MAGVALGNIDLHFAGQAWHLATSPPLCVAGVALTALGWLWWRAWFQVDAVVATAVGVAGVAGVALGDIDLHFAGQACTWRHGPSLYVAGVALGDIDLHFAWQVWHL